MTPPEPSVEQQSGPFDALIERLQQRRIEAGLPSYGEIAQRVSRVREARGVSPGQARVGRTTVYDVFRVGRRRLDIDLLVDIARALGADEPEAERWAAEAKAAQAAALGMPTVDPEPEPEPDPEPESASVAPERRWAILLGFAALCVVGNLVGRGLVDLLQLPIFLDMWATALAAMVLGPWWGAAVGAATNVAGSATVGALSMWFSPVNVLGGLLWGWGIHRWGMGRSIPRFFALNVVVALACTLVAVPITLVVFDGYASPGHSAIAERLVGFGTPLVLAVFFSNVVTSLADKFISGFASLATIEMLPPGLRARLGSKWMGGTESSEE